MNELLKNILKGIGIYHPLQSSYRSMITSVQNNKYRRQYKQYEGSGFTCNVCSSVYSKFVPDHPTAENKAAIGRNHVIAGYGDNIICPNCMSTARERLIIAFLKDKIDITGKKILHFSPEKNIYNYLKEKASVTTADLLPGFYKAIDQTIQKQDATRLGYNDKSFDMVIANHILEHIPADIQAMQEIFRVLKSNALAILQVPYSATLPATIEDPSINDPVKQSALYGQKDHVRIYALNDYVQRLRSVGFYVEVMSVDQYSIFATQVEEKLLRIVKPG